MFERGHIFGEDHFTGHAECAEHASGPVETPKQIRGDGEDQIMIEIEIEKAAAGGYGVGSRQHPCQHEVNDLIDADVLPDGLPVA